MSAPIEKYHIQSEKQDWETPQALFDRLNREFRFTLDVCATDKTAKCARYFTPETDGLSQDWGREVCWMNPPYGRAIREWMRKAFESAEEGATVVCLVPARTDSAWWHEYAINGEIEWIRGRIKFVGAPYNAPFPSAVVVLRPPKQAAA